MKFNVFIFESFQPQNDHILFLFSTMKLTYLVILLGYFNTSFEEYKVLYPMEHPIRSRNVTFTVVSSFYVSSVYSKYIQVSF